MTKITLPRLRSPRVLTTVYKDGLTTLPATSDSPRVLVKAMELTGRIDPR